MKTITILGSGTSTGIPMTGCHCPVCQSTDRKDKRYRTSILIESNGKKILVDTSPDLRSQLLANKIDDIDAVIITHTHADHLHGIDDLRPFCFRRKTPIPLYVSSETGNEIFHRFPYIFQADKLFDSNRPILGGGIPNLELVSMELKLPPTAREIVGGEFTFFNLPHSYCQTMGFMHGKMAYLTDCNSIPAPVMDFLKQQQLELVIIDCLRQRQHKTHLTTDEAFRLIDEISPKRAGLIHISHDLTHQELSELASRQPNIDIFPTFDQQRITIHE